MANFLLEIGTEEIPDWMIEPALADLRTKFEAAFGKFGGSALILAATPRRLALRATGLNDQAPDSENVVFGPYLSAGQKAAEGFAKKWGSRIDQLKTTQDARGERYVMSELVKGQNVKEGLAEKLPSIIANIQFPKSMSWPGSAGVRFIRPIRWVVALLDDQPVEFSVAAIASGNTTRGHRILGSKEPIPVTISTYEEALRKNGVLIKAEERRERITSQLGEGAQKDDDLLATLIYLTEFPSVIRGKFDPAYLELPQEILSTVMRHHQRYFSVIDEAATLRPEFVAVTNTDSDPDGLIRQGNERVLRARFNDARFFWRTDQRKPLSDRIPDLENVVFHAKLGTYAAKTTRVTELGTRLAGQVGADLAVVARACLLAKADLTTEMVKEFTELQGIVGGLYARIQGEDERVAVAIYDQYKPVSMEDSIPRTVEGQIVAIADKLDALRECFHVRMIPTGSKDPFALRRAAQGIVKILFEARLPLAPMNLVDDVAELPAFLKERVQYYLRDVRGYAYDEVNAVLSAGLSTLHDAADRIEAIHFIRPTNDFEPVAASFKRIKNILKQAQVSASGEPDPKLLTPGPEQDLYRAFASVRSRMSSSNGYRSKLEAMASLRPQVDLFFDKILVNDSNPAIRQNRLALLNCLLTEFSNIADFSEIVTQGGL
jgi:glycyl-tRNA synthetase beta chain